MSAVVNRFALPAFAKNVLTLVSGTVLAQGVMLLALPVLTHIYEPAAFGLLGIYLSTLMLLIVASCLRLELAIPLPEKDEDAVALMACSAIAAAALTFMFAIVLFLAAKPFVTMLGEPGIAPYFWMFPAGFLLAAIYSIFQLWAVRKGRYRQVAHTQLTRAVGGAGAQIGLGAAGVSPFGLLFGHMLYTGLGSVGLAIQFWRQDRRLLASLDRARMWRNLREQRRFPLISTPESLINSAAINMPLLLIAAIAGSAEAGFLLLAQRVSSIPISLIGGNISRVFLAEAPAKLREEHLGPFTRKIIGKLAVFGAAPFLFLALLSPWGFPFLFGSEWDRAGQMLTWLAPSLFLQFIVSPVSTILSVLQKQFVSLVLQIFGAICTLGGIALATIISPESAFEFFAVGAIIYYAAYLAVVLNHTRKA